MKFVLLLIIILSFSIRVTKGQERFNLYPDSVRIELPDQKSVIVFELQQIRKSSVFITGFPTYLKEILSYVQKSSAIDLVTSRPYHIDVKIIPEGEEFTLSIGKEMYTKPTNEKMHISFKTLEAEQTQLTVRDKEIVELLPPGWELVILSKEFKVSVYSQSFQSLMDITGVNLTDVTTKVIADADFKTLGRKSIKSRMVVRDNKINQTYFERPHPLDMLFISGLGGVGLVRDQIYPQLSVKAGLTFNDRFKRPNIRPSILYDALFFAEKTTEGYQMNVNGFLSVSFEKNFNKKSRNPNWGGIGAGLLVRQNGDYFRGNTMKFFISHETESRISIVPEFYLTDDFKKFTFGTTLRYTF